jgi:ABC-type transporter Mla subunit MlaD
MSTKAAALAQMQALIDGLQKHYPNGQFTFGNVTYTTQDLVTLFKSLMTAIVAVNAAQASAKDAVQTMNGVKAKVTPVFRALKRNLQTTYGTATQTLADFSLEPETAPTPLTVEQKAAAKAKADATREARGTASKKQKSAIHGNVTGVTVTPVTVTTEPAPAAQLAATTTTTPAPGPSK